MIFGGREDFKIGFRSRLTAYQISGDLACRILRDMEFQQAYWEKNLWIAAYMMVGALHKWTLAVDMVSQTLAMGESKKHLIQIRDVPLLALIARGMSHGLILFCCPVFMIPMWLSVIVPPWFPWFVFVSQGCSLVSRIFVQSFVQYWSISSNHFAEEF